MEPDDRPDVEIDSAEMPVIPDGYFDIKSDVAWPEYHVEEASAKLELYTLKEAISDERLVEMFAPLFSSGFVAKPEEPFARGLVIFATPQIDTEGEFFQHSAEIRARVEVPAQDIVVVIARTSAKVSVALDVKGKGKLARTLLVLAQEGSTIRVHTNASEGAEGQLAQSTYVIAGDHAKVTIEDTGVTSVLKKIASASAEILA